MRQDFGVQGLQTPKSWDRRPLTRNRGLELPAFEIGSPILINSQMRAKQIGGVCRWFARDAHQDHARLPQRPPPFSQVACGASRHEVGPTVVAPSVARGNVVNREVTRVRAAILAHVLISPKDLSLAEADSWARPLDHVAEADHRGAGDGNPHRADHPSAIEQHLRLAGKQQADGAASGNHVERLEVRVKDQHGRVHRRNLNRLDYNISHCLGNPAGMRGASHVRGQRTVLDASGHQ